MTSINKKIRKILKENALKEKFEKILQTKGIDYASQLVGSSKNVAKILDLDLNDVNTQEMLVKNFLDHVEVDEVNISFIEVRNSVFGGKILKVYFETTSGAANITTWFDRVISDYLSENLFPFKVAPSWEPNFANRNVKIFLDSEVIKYDDHGNVVNESKNKQKKLNENWSRKNRIKKILQEETKKQNENYTLYVDMGGVLFEKNSADDGGQGESTNYIGKELWESIKKYNPIILSARGTKNIEKNEKIKTDQVKKYLSPEPKIIFVGTGNEKGDKERANKNSILIDDSQTNIDSWKSKGGIGIKHDYKNTQSTIDKLKEIFSK
jgi:hypothetical protein